MIFAYCICVILDFMLLWRLVSVSSDRVRTLRERTIHVSYPSFPFMWIHDQLHPQAEAPAREVYDEQRTGELYHPAGTCDKTIEPLGYTLCVCVFIYCYGRKLWSHFTVYCSMYVTHKAAPIWFSFFSRHLLHLQPVAAAVVIRATGPVVQYVSWCFLWLSECFCTDPTVGNCVKQDCAGLASLNIFLVSCSFHYSLDFTEWDGVFLRGRSEQRGVRHHSNKVVLNTRVQRLWCPFHWRLHSYLPRDNDYIQPTLTATGQHVIRFLNGLI